MKEEPKHPGEERLNDLVDGILDSGDEARVQRHLDECIECRRTVDSLRDLLQAAACLPEIRPERDLLRGLRVSAARPRMGWQRWGALAATLLVLLAGSLAALRWSRGLQPGLVSATPVQRTVDPLAEIRAAEQQYVEASARLLAALNQRRAQLSPETVALVEDNVRLIDEAIEDVRSALDRETVDAERTRLLADLYRKKLQLLWTASRLPS